jgi:hypothetical protein
MTCNFLYQYTSHLLILLDLFFFQYYLFTNTIHDGVQFHVDNVYMSLRTCANSITAASTINNSFPFVTVPKFEVMAGGAREQSGMEMLFSSPIIQQSQYNAWINYSAANQGWVNESRQLAAAASDSGQLDMANYVIHEIPHFIWERDPLNESVIRPTTAGAPYMPYVL